MSQDKQPWLGVINYQGDESPQSSIFVLQNDSEKRGHLVVTNQRLLFVAIEGYLSRKRYHLFWAADLASIESVDVVGWVVKNLVVLFRNNQRVAFRTYGRTDAESEEREVFKEHLQAAIPRRRAAFEEEQRREEEKRREERRKERIQIVLDFGSLREVMQQGGLAMRAYKCPNCQSSLPLPDKGEVLVCDYCKTVIKPIDIFEKIKQLLE